MKPKEIEEKGIEVFRSYVKEAYPNSKIDDKHKGRCGYDLELTINGKTYYVEIKASTSKNIPSNIRFTHQTISTMYEKRILRNLIVVCVYNIGRGGGAKFKFFRFGDIPQKHIHVEPHFIIQPNDVQRNNNDDVIVKDLEKVIRRVDNSQATQYDNIKDVLNSKVCEHMKLDCLHGEE